MSETKKKSKWKNWEKNERNWEKNERNERTLQCSNGGGDEMSGEVRTVLESGGWRGGETHERLGDRASGARWGEDWGEEHEMKKVIQP
jgi:hypothetical protein